MNSLVRQGLEYIAAAVTLGLAGLVMAPSLLLPSAALFALFGLGLVAYGLLR